MKNTGASTSAATESRRLVAVPLRTRRNDTDQARVRVAGLRVGLGGRYYFLRCGVLQRRAELWAVLSMGLSPSVGPCVGTSHGLIHRY